MAAPLGSHRQLAGEVRKLALDKIKVILLRPSVEMSERDKELHDQILLKLAGSILPRLAEVTGEDGAPLLIQVAKEVAEKNNVTDTISSGNSQGPA